MTLRRQRYDCQDTLKGFADDQDQSGLCRIVQPHPCRIVNYIVVCHLWGGSIPTIKVSERGIPPLLTATLRSLVGAILLTILAWAKGDPILMRGKKFWHGVILGALFGLTMLCLYWGLVFTEASRGTIFYSTKPFGVAAGAHLFLPDDRLTKVKVLGLALALVGSI